MSATIIAAVLVAVVNLHPALISEVGRQVGCEKR